MKCYYHEGRLSCFAMEKVKSPGPELKANKKPNDEEEIAAKDGGHDVVKTVQELITEFRPTGSDSSCDADDQNGPTPKKKKTTPNRRKDYKEGIRNRTYKIEWESNPVFKQFVSRSFKSEHYFFCKSCNKDYACGSSEILRHMKSQKHIRNSKTQVKLKDVKFEGLLCPVFTPFAKSKDMEIDYTTIQEYAEYLKSHGVKGILINDIIGEGMTLTISERMSVAEEWSKACQDTDLYLMIQIGGAPLKDIQKMARHAEKLKMKSIVILPDLYNKPKDHYELLRYIKSISVYADNVPLLYHHNPSYTNVNIDVTQLLKDAIEIKSFVGIIYNSNDLADAISSLHVNDDFVIILSCDEIILPASFSGFNSIISPSLNFVPKLVQDILKSDTVQAAQKAQTALNDIISAIKQKGQYISSLKCAMNLLTQINVGSVREPLINIWQDKQKNLERELRCLTSYESFQEDDDYLLKKQHPVNSSPDK